MTRLVFPHARHHASWLESVQEFGDEPINGSGLWHWSAGSADFGPSGYDAFIAELKHYGDVSIPAANGKVHCNYYWIVDGAPERVVGFLA